MLENKYEKLAWKANKKVMGIDEAGRCHIPHTIPMKNAAFQKDLPRSAEAR